jgi:uncharacterized protein YbjT (DUF2867 family)
MYVVAGVTGHVGSTVVRELLAKSKKVRVIVRDAKKGEAFAKQGAEVATGSLEDQAFLTGALRGATGFFTLLPPNMAVHDVYASQCKAADAIAGAVATAKVPHVVLLSSVGADLESGTGPIKGLHYLEAALRKTGTLLTAIRAGMFQENVGNSVGAAKAQGVLFSFMPTADTTMPMIATRDIGMLAAEQLLATPKKSEVIDLQGPAYSQRQVAEKLGSAIGKKLKIVDVPQTGWLDAMMKGGMPKPFAESYAEMYTAFGSGKVRPNGDRLVQGKTTLDEVVHTLV